MGIRWSEVAARYRDAQVVLPWSDVANFVIVDRGRCASASADAQMPVRTGKWSTAERASLSGEAILVWTGGDGGYKVLIRVHERRPTDLLPGRSLLCPLDAPTGELVVHCGTFAFSLPELPDREDEEVDADEADEEDEYEDVTAEQRANIPPGRYLAHLTYAEFDDYDLDDDDDVRAPDYVLDLWPAASDPDARLHWQRLG